MDVYVATKAENYRIARVFMRALEEAGHDITHDWTKQVAEIGPSPDDKMVARRCAEQDNLGVAQADVLILIAYPGLTGGLVEFGIALGHGIPVLLVGTLTRYTIFQELPQVLCFSDNIMSIKAIVEEVDLMHANAQVKAGLDGTHG